MSVHLIGDAGTVRQWNEKPLLRRFGANPFGENLFRVVFADSRKHMVGGTWKDYSGAPAKDKELVNGKDKNIVREITEYRWIPLYPGFHGWVIEKWLSGLEFAGTPFSYELLQADTESGLLPLPYPTRGEYVESQKLLVGMEPTISLVAEIIHLVQMGENSSFAEKKRAIVSDLEKNEKARNDRAEAIWTNAQGAFNNKPSNVNPGKRTADDIKFRYSAGDLKHLPQKAGAFVSLGENPKI